MVMLLFFLSNNLFFFHLLGNFLHVVRCIFWETITDDVILDFLCAYLAHHIVCTSNSRIIYYSIMLILYKKVITRYFVGERLILDKSGASPWSYSLASVRSAS